MSDYQNNNKTKYSKTHNIDIIFQRYNTLLNSIEKESKQFSYPLHQSTLHILIMKYSIFIPRHSFLFIETPIRKHCRTYLNIRIP